MQDNYEDLKKWSTSFNSEFYFVQAIRLGTYNFEKEGFPIENNALFRGSLVKMSPSKAEAFVREHKTKRLLAVFKQHYLKIEDPSKPVNVELSSPKVEIYQDEALTYKIDEITIKTELKNEGKLESQKAGEINPDRNKPTNSEAKFTVGEIVIITRYLNHQGEIMEVKPRIVKSTNDILYYYMVKFVMRDGKTVSTSKFSEKVLKKL